MLNHQPLSPRRQAISHQGYMVPVQLGSRSWQTYEALGCLQRLWVPAMGRSSPGLGIPGTLVPCGMVLPRLRQRRQGLCSEAAAGPSYASSPHAHTSSGSMRNGRKDCIQQCTICTIYWEDVTLWSFAKSNTEEIPVLKESLQKGINRTRPQHVNNLHTLRDADYKSNTRDRKFDTENSRLVYFAWEVQ